MAVPVLRLTAVTITINPMRRIKPLVTVFVLVLLLLVVPAGVMGNDAIDARGIELRPHDGPNDQYASFDGDDHLRIDLGDDMVLDAVITFAGVFDILNTGPESVRVWVTHESTEQVVFKTGKDGPIQGREDSTVIPPGAVRVVGLTVDTHGMAPGESIIDGITIHAETVTGETPTPVETVPSGILNDDPQETGDKTVIDSGRVRLAIDRELAPDESVSVTAEDRLPPVSSTVGIRAVIGLVAESRNTGDSAVTSNPGLEEYGADGVVNPGRPALLTGRPTIIDSAEAIAPATGPLAIFDVRAPPAVRNSSGTIWLTIDRDRFGSGDPTEARVIRQHQGGWRLLDTTVHRMNETHVVLEARTAGFSRLAVIPRSTLSYDWSLPAGPVQGEVVSFHPGNSGVHPVTLSVIDGLGRRDETGYRLLVNDRPDVVIENTGEIVPGEPVTLQANVSDQYGETTVSWMFHDGSSSRGPTVTRAFEAGKHDVTVSVEDEFGATTIVEAEFVVGQRDPIVRIVEYALGVEGRFAVIGFATLFVLGAARLIIDALRGDRGGRYRR